MVASKRIAATALTLIVQSFPASAQSPYVDTSKLTSHVEMGPPPILLASDHILGRAENQFWRVIEENTPGVVDRVATAKKTAKASVGVDGTIRTAAAQATHKEHSGYVLGSFRRDDAEDYKADGTQLHYGYDRTMGQFVVGFTPNADTDLKFVGVMDRLDDDLQPHYALDPLKTDRYIGKTILAVKDIGGFKDIQAYASAIDFSRRADNYSLRTPGATNLRIDVDRNVYELGGAGHFDLGAFASAIGFSVKDDTHDATRFNVTAGDIINSYRFPGVEQTGASLWGEAQTQLSQSDQLIFGLRYDYLDAEATKASLTPSTGVALFDVSPMTLYQTYYGVSDAKVTDHNISGKIKLEHHLSDSNSVLFGELGRMARSPNNIERWHAVSGPTASRWIGNPALKPEKHNKAEVGVEFKGSGYKDYQRSVSPGDSWKTKFSVYYDRVDDFVTFDKARGQAGVLQTDSATISRNVDAVLAGVSAESQWNVNSNFATKLVASYTYGDNVTDSRALYQVRPLEANFLVDYTDDLGVIGTWSVGSNIRFSGRQTRLDDDTATGLGMDNDGTSGAFTIFNIYGGVQFYNRVGLSLGINNLFDKRYNEHLTGGHIADPGRTAVVAPGRTFYLRTLVNF